MNKIKVIITKKNIDYTDVYNIYYKVGWIKKTEKFNEKSVENIIKKSYCFACAIDKKKIIGIGRAISDGTSDAYIQDVAVLENYRKKGIGKQIIVKLIDHLKKKKIGWIGLITEPGSSEFYKKLGFKKMDKHIPMIYNFNREL